MLKVLRPRVPRNDPSGSDAAQIVRLRHTTWAVAADRTRRPRPAGHLSVFPEPSNLADCALSLADASVDPFPQQVGVAAVAGVLLDHVDQHFA